VLRILPRGTILEGLRGSSRASERAILGAPGIGVPDASERATPGGLGGLMLRLLPRGAILGGSGGLPPGLA
jgi:hypothetical protein